MGGRTDGLDAMLTADSPQGLIDQLAVQRVMAAEMSAQMKSYRDIGRQAALAEEASAKSAADAKTAAEQAAAVRADLQSKQSQLQVQIAVVKSQYTALTPAQREALAAMPPLPAPPARRPPPRGRAIPASWPPRPAASRPATSHRPEAVAPGGRAPRGGHRHPGRAEPDRLALLVGRARARTVRLLRTGDVGLPAGRHLAAALQPGAGPGRAAGVDGPDAAGRPGHLLLRRVARRPSTSATE